ncbi:hypothetical protein [Agrobacterium tumefaciens]|uniref:hypothetical protein n=1 Tax=Agrobacterium tumefaciens TaxID=358 RepID=UPI001891736C|nr:hypothetical protein [Agrobacterium tumefaciens]
MTGDMPQIDGAFGFPSFAFAFPALDFPSLSLPALHLSLPEAQGWLPNSRIIWDRPPILRLEQSPTVSLRIDDGSDPGEPLSGHLEIEGVSLLRIEHFRVSGPLSAIGIEQSIAILTPEQKLADRTINLGPLHLGWRSVSVEAALKAKELTVTTSVSSLALWGDDPSALIEVGFDLVTVYNLETASSEQRFEKFALLAPGTGEVGAAIVRSLGGLTRFFVPVTLTPIGDANELLTRLAELVETVIRWLGGHASSAAQAVLGLGRGVTDFGRRLFDRLGELGAKNTTLLLEIRWDSAARRIKQIIISRTGDTLAAGHMSQGELSVEFGGTSSPFLVFDLVDNWWAVAVAPITDVLTVQYATDLWLNSDAGMSATRSQDGRPLLTIDAKLHQASGKSVSLIALALVQSGQARFLQKLGAGPAEQIRGGVSIGVPLVPGDHEIQMDLDVKLNQDKLTSIFPVGSGTSQSSAPTIKVLGWTQVSAEGTLLTYDINLEIDARLGGRPLNSTMQGSFDTRTFTLRLKAADIPIDCPETIDVFGARLSVEPPQGGMVLRLSEAPSIRLAKLARAILAFDQIGSGNESLSFEAEGERGFALGTEGLDLEADVVERPVRLRGLDTPFRFSSGQVRMERSRLLSASIVGSGALPPALLGEAKIDVGIQIGHDTSSNVFNIQSATARLERASEPVICEGTRFHFELTHVGLGFKYFDNLAHFYGELTGSAKFRPNPGELASGLLSRLQEACINLDRAPIAGDGRALSKAINFQVPIDPPARATLFNEFDFELRGVGFHPAFDGWSDNPPAVALSGQARFTDSFDVVQPSFEFHKLWVARPENGKTLPRVRMDGLGVGLKIGAIGEFEATAIAVDGSLPSLYAPDVLPANVTAQGFLASGRLMLKGWAAMSGAAGFLELERKDHPGDRRLSFFVYAQQEQLAEPIPTPVGTLYLREVGFGLGYRYTLAALAQTETLTDPRDLITVLDPISKRQGDLASFSAWQPEVTGDRVTLAMRALFSVTTASSPTVYNEQGEKDLDNPVLFDVVAALRSDLTFLLSARAWVAVNYADWRNGQKEWREKPLLRGYLYISAPKKTFLGRLISDKTGYIGEHPKLPEPLKKALKSVEFSSTLYITPGLYHHELGWPYELKLELGTPKDKIYVALSGGMVVRIEDGAILHGLAFAARGHVKVGGRAGGSVGASAEAVANFALDSKFIAYVSAARPIESLFYGRMQLAIALDFSISFWVDTKFFSASASWVERVDVGVDLELAVSPQGIGAHARASLSIRRFGRGLRLGVSLGVNEAMLGNARARVERFMALGLGATVPDSASGLAPLPEPARAQRAMAGDRALDALAKRRDANPLPPGDEAARTPGPPVTGEAISGCDFWAIVFPIKGSNGRAILQFVPRDPEPEKDVMFIPDRDHGDFFVSPFPSLNSSDPHLTDGHEYLLMTDVDDVLSTLLEGAAKTARTASRKPNWDKIIDRSSGSTVADLVSTGFLAPKSGRFTQPKSELSVAAGPDERADTIGCLEARGGLIGLICDRAKQLAEASTSGWVTASPDVIDPRFFGLTFEIGIDDPKVPLGVTLDTLFSPNDAGIGPRMAKFTISKSDDTANGTPRISTVALLNPIERMFANAQPQLAKPKGVIEGDTVKLYWQLLPAWGMFASDYDEPENHLLHYAIQRHIRVGNDLSKRFFSNWLSKRGKAIDAMAAAGGDDFQALDDLKDLPDDLRRAILFFQRYKPAQPVSQTQSIEYEGHLEVWNKNFGTEKPTLVYSVVSIDNAGTKTDPSLPICVDLPEPEARRRRPLTRLGIEFDYVSEAGKEFTFPRKDDVLPARLSVFMQKEDTKDADGKYRKPTEIELYIDSEDGERSGIYGADLLDVERHYKRFVDPVCNATDTLTWDRKEAGSVPVNLYLIEPGHSDLTIAPITLYCKAELLLQLTSPGHRSTQIFARLPGKPLEPSHWTLCDLKIRIARKPQGDTPPLTGNQPDDFIAPVAEFELPRVAAPRLLGYAAMSAEKGLLHHLVPLPGAEFNGSDKLTLRTDVKGRSAIKLSWNARPTDLCDGTAIRPDLIGGFDVFTASRDREPPQSAPLSAAELARLARPLGRVLVKPRALANSEPAMIEDLSKLLVAYPSETLRSREQGWFSASQSRLIWPERTARRALMLVPDEGLIGELFGHGQPGEMRVRLLEVEHRTDRETSVPARMVLNTDGALLAKDALAEPDAADGKWQHVKITHLTPQLARAVLQGLDREEKAPAYAQGRLEIAYRSGGVARTASVDVSFNSELHPVLADVIDLLRYQKDDFSRATGYRRYEPVLEGAPAAQAGVIVDGGNSAAANRLRAAQLLSDTAPERDKGGWAALRQLGLAAGFRLWDTVFEDWVKPTDLKDQFEWAWKLAIARNSGSSWKFGTPFIEQFFDPEELLIVGGEDRIHRPRHTSPKGLPLVQISLRPTIDRLHSDGDDRQKPMIQYFKLDIDKPSTLTADALSRSFHGDVIIEFRTAEARNTQSVWVGSFSKLRGDEFEPLSEYTFMPPTNGLKLVARAVIFNGRFSPGQAAEQIQGCFSSGWPKTEPILWTPLESNDPPVNPYLMFDDLPLEVARRIEDLRGNGHHRLRQLAGPRYEGWTNTLDETGAIRRWEKRFFQHGIAHWRDDFQHVGFAVATMDAPAALRRTPDARGRISVLWIDESHLGSWRRFYIRPFGRYDHLAEASGWPCADASCLVETDFGGAVSSTPWIDVTLDRTREVARPVLLASAYSADAKALIAVVAHSDEEVLASANIPQAGARQIGSSDIGWRHRLRTSALPWVASMLPGTPDRPPLRSKLLAAPDTGALSKWLIDQATPPARGTTVKRGLPDIWRGANAVAAYDLPYFFEYEVLLSNSAGVASSTPVSSALPTPDAATDIDWKDTPRIVTDTHSRETTITFPLARYVDCMDKDSRDAWYDVNHSSAALFELPDPALVYRFQMISPDGDIRSPEFDLEADAQLGAYAIRVTGRNFDLKRVERPTKNGRQWSVSFTLRSNGTGMGGLATVEAVPIRNTIRLRPVNIGELS